jgi:type II secretory ATPase GspE/PulE/Tfp pilus assembly ATPase PilB-like protein
MLEIYQEIKSQTRFENHQFNALQKFRLFLKEKITQLASNAKYAEAQKAQVILEDLKFYLSQTIQQPSSKSAHSLTNSTQFHEQDLTEKIDEAFTQRMNILRQKHQKQANDFEEKWNHQKLRKNEKASNTLINLRSFEKSLAKAGNYENASQIHVEASEL